MRKSLKIILIIFFSLLVLWFLIRLISPREIDDVSPGIPCENEKEYIEKSEYLWVIPLLNNISIAENKTWCNEILAMNKTLGMHGIKHTYWEFKIENISQEELQEGIKIFEECFGYKPKNFKAPQLRLNEKNKNLIGENHLIIKSKLNQAIHKVYHCDNTGVLSNKFIDLF